MGHQQTVLGGIDKGSSSLGGKVSKYGNESGHTLTRTAFLFYILLLNEEGARKKFFDHENNFANGMFP